MLSVQTPYDLGLLLRTARQQLGLTQAKLALAAGVGVRFVVDLEAGKPTVRLASVMQFRGCPFLQVIRHDTLAYVA
jgi:HTH-type transcriptional regulator / antitoxin HipB